MIDRPKLLAIASFIISLPAGYYFLDADILRGAIFVLMSDMFDRISERAKKGNAKAGWNPAIKTAIDRCSDSAIFIGFALSGIIPREYGIVLLVAAVMIPFWTQILWKKNVRWIIHAVIYAYAVSSLI